ncbi:hypothetical protein ENBRE01_1525 [Enteropsectra breve]|nr:hypothetical protein ENBRE01_1525 [Enteropsectra breve]
MKNPTALLKLGRLSLAPTKAPSYYKAEARALLKRIKTQDSNFKYFLDEIIECSRDNLEIEYLRGLVSDLQRYICVRSAKEQDSKINAVKIKIKGKHMDISDI